MSNGKENGQWLNIDENWIDFPETDTANDPDLRALVERVRDESIARGDIRGPSVNPSDIRLAISTDMLSDREVQQLNGIVSPKGLWRGIRRRLGYE